jgi:hypothetical protein
MEPSASIEEEADQRERRRLFLSMRTKLCLGSLCFFFLMSSIAYIKTPYLVTSLQRLAQNNTASIIQTGPYIQITAMHVPIIFTMTCVLTVIPSPILKFQIHKRISEPREEAYHASG